MLVGTRVGVACLTVGFVPDVSKVISVNAFVTATLEFAKLAFASHVLVPTFINVCPRSWGFPKESYTVRDETALAPGNASPDKLLAYTNLVDAKEGMVAPLGT